jgi:hypothetical protein
VLISVSGNGPSVIAAPAVYTRWSNAPSRSKQRLDLGFRLNVSVIGHDFSGYCSGLAHGRPVRAGP